MAKNDYCTKYPDLMKIQCKKSCKFCGRKPFLFLILSHTNSDFKICSPFMKNANLPIVGILGENVHTYRNLLDLMNF